MEKSNYKPFGDEWIHYVKKHWNKDKLILELRDALIKVQKQKEIIEIIKKNSKNIIEMNSYCLSDFNCTSIDYGYNLAVDEILICFSEL